MRRRVKHEDMKHEKLLTAALHVSCYHVSRFSTMTELDFESDPKLELLTDALRAGPGTPQWRQALGAVEHTPGSDEFKALYTARERLASGRGYREVRAG